MPSDIEIAQLAKLKKVSEIAKSLGLAEESVEHYGQYKAKIDTKLNPQLDAQKDGKLILDFNRAENPPCAWTAYATCPLPPKENALSVPVEAGEMFTGHH